MTEKVNQFSIESKAKTITVILIPFLFLCAGLYHLAYWSPFNINIFPFLDITDIILSVLHPLIYVFFTGILLFLFNPTVIDLSNIITFDDEFKKSKKYWWLLFIVRNVYLIIIVYFLFVDSNKWKGEYVPFIFIPGVYYLIYWSIEELKISTQSKKISPIITFIIFLPVSCFVFGTVSAHSTHSNKHYSYIIDKQTNAKIKFLGKVSDHFVFISMNNKESYFISTDEMKRMELKKSEW